MKFKKILPIVYLFVCLVSLVLFLLIYKFPSLVLPLHGSMISWGMPIGFLIFLIASWPGYFFGYFIPMGGNLFLLMIFSLFFYHFVGSKIDIWLRNFSLKDFKNQTSKPFSLKKSFKMIKNNLLFLIGFFVIFFFEVVFSFIQYFSDYEIGKEPYWVLIPFFGLAWFFSSLFLGRFKRK